MLQRKFQVLAELGKGSYGSVLKAVRRQDKQVYAVKRVYIKSLSAKEVNNSVNEVRLLASINSPYIVSYREAFYDQEDQSLNIVMEFAEDGDLYKLVASRKEQKKPFAQDEIWCAASQMLTGLSQLHSHKIIHRDLKSANIFLAGGLFKLGDFNVSKVLKDQLAHTQTGTPYYASPQIWKQLPYNQKSDIWSLGCILYEMCALRPPFMAASMEQLARKVVKGNYERIPSRYSPELNSFIASMLRVKAQERADIRTLLKHPSLPPCDSGQRCSESYLLHTIKVPKNLRKLTQSLPTENYMPSFQSEPTLPPATRRKRKETSLMPMPPRRSHKLVTQPNGAQPLGYLPPIDSPDLVQQALAVPNSIEIVRRKSKAQIQKARDIDYEQLISLERQAYMRERNSKQRLPQALLHVGSDDIRSRKVVNLMPRPQKLQPLALRIVQPQSVRKQSVKRGPSVSVEDKLKSMERELFGLQRALRKCPSNASQFQQPEWWG